MNGDTEREAGRMRISELAERYGAKPTQARYDALIEGIKASDKSIVSVVRCKDCKCG